MNKLFSYNKPDKYEKYCGIKHIRRAWCFDKKLDPTFYSTRNYDLDLLEPIYTQGYRDPSFRDETIEETFNRIVNLPVDKSENVQRFKWFNANVDMRCGKVLDIGSGFGVWPYILNKVGWNVECIEPNEDSCNFIRDHLNIPCSNEFFYGHVDHPYDIISIIHVLEHIVDPHDFLQKVMGCLEWGGKLFIEVPDAVEFTYLPKDHDEFNSCHIWFFSADSLLRMLNDCNINVIHLHRPYYKDRKLSRIQVICDRRKR